MGQPLEPLPSPERAATTPPDQKTTDAIRTEIIVLAIGILFLVSQLIIVIWIFAPRALVRRLREQRSIEWRPVDLDPVAQGANSSNEDDGRPVRRRNFRRSSTWNGRFITISHGCHPVRRRKSSGLKPAADLRTFCSSDQDADSPERDSRVREGFQDTGLAAASFAVPMVALSPRRWRSPLSSSKPELDSDDSNGRVPEMGPLPATFSPRSPRSGPINVATINAVFQGIERKPDTTLVDPPVVDGTDLANGFNDPLEVNRRETLFGIDNSSLLHVTTSGEETLDYDAS